MKRTKFLIIGFGSVAQKHIKNIQKISPEAIISVCSSQKPNAQMIRAGVVMSSDLYELIALEPNFVIIASQSSSHFEHYKALSCLDVPILIEKPITSSFCDAAQLLDLSTNFIRIPLVAYNLRFLRALDVMSSIIQNRKFGRIHSVHCVVGQDLEMWRPGRKLENTVSVSRKKGGGVLRELSHEIDYMCHLFGSVELVNALVGRQKFRQFDVEDTAMVQLLYANAGQTLMASINMDFTRKDTTRHCHVICDDATVRWDIIAGEVISFSKHQKKTILFHHPDDLRRSGYRMMECFVNQETESFCSVSEAVNHVKLIEEIEAQSAVFK